MRYLKGASFVVVIALVLTAIAFAGAPGKPLCKQFSTFQIDRLNQPISPCNLYFYADRISHHPRESYFRVVIRRGLPVAFVNGEPSSDGALQPYWYRWVVVDADGKVERSWLAYFMRNRDGTYHTIVKLSDDEWKRSRLEIYFEDVDDDGVREDVTYVLPIRLAIEPK